MKELAVIILDWNGAEDTIECLKTLNNRLLYDIYLLDNGSKAENNMKISDFLSNSDYKGNWLETKLDLLEPGKNELTYIHSEKNLGFAVGNNVVADRICNSCKYILLLNNDTEVPEGTIESMIRTAKEKKTVALTCDIRIYDRKDELWNAGGYFTILGERKYYSQKKINKLKEKKVTFLEAQYITGCALLIDSSYIRENGLFTDKFFHGEEDFNFCYKLYKNKALAGVDLSVTLYHKVGRSIKRHVGKETYYNSLVVNYSNRVIDFKEFYGTLRWKVWRIIYLTLLLFLRILKGMKPLVALELCKRIYKISNKNDNLRKKLFDEIMSMEW
ncbi:MAG: glycosyltransferase family 2 protein [Lachnospiraceae bacterium]|nr:glycosyltransferase family 2 protein [Lachnospiraceae bacterium]